MVAEDFEDDYFETDEARDRDFLTALYGLTWALGSVPFMFLFMFLMCGVIPAIWATAALLTIYIVFGFIEISSECNPTFSKVG